MFSCGWAFVWFGLGCLFVFSVCFGDDKGDVSLHIKLMSLTF